MCGILGVSLKNDGGMIPVGHRVCLMATWCNWCDTEGWGHLEKELVQALVLVSVDVCNLMYLGEGAGVTMEWGGRLQCISVLQNMTCRLNFKKAYSGS